MVKRKKDDLGWLPAISVDPAEVEPSSGKGEAPAFVAEGLWDVTSIATDEERSRGRTSRQELDVLAYDLARTHTKRAESYATGSDVEQDTVDLVLEAGLWQK